MTQRKDELLLSEHFAEGVRRVRKKMVGAPLHIVNFDWHATMTNLKEKGTVEGLWAILAAILPQVHLDNSNDTGFDLLGMHDTGGADMNFQCLKLVSQISYPAPGAPGRQQ